MSGLSVQGSSTQIGKARLFNYLQQSNVLGDNELKFNGWQSIKANAPAGPLNFRKMMAEVELELSRSGKKLADNVQQLFQGFGKKLFPHFRAYYVPEKNRFISELQLAKLQNLALKQCENKALIKIWKEYLAPTFQLQNVPNLQTHEQIRAWINNPENAARLQEVTVLELQYSNLNALPPEIGKLTSLRKLDLRNNQLTSLPPEIRGLTALRTLWLANNQLASIPPEIGSLTALKDLWLANNQLTSIPPEIGNLTALEDLWFSYNQLTSIPPEIGRLISLQRLYLRHNPLKSLLPEIGCLTDLRRLDITDNLLTSLPAEIGYLTALQELYLSDNLLTSFPTVICRLPVLKDLAIRNNQLSSLPPEIGSLTNLRWFYLQNNLLTSLPPEIGNLTVLEWFYLQNNLLTSLPPEISNLTVLEWFYLQNNLLTSLPPEISNLTVLEWFYLDNNKFISLPAEIAQLTNLKNLAFEGNPLLFLSDHQLKSIPYFKTVLAHYNTFMGYPTQSSLGNLFKLIASNEIPANIQNTFEELDPALQQRIAQLAGVPATSTSSSSSSSSTHIDESLFEDIPRLGRAVREATIEMYNDLSPEQKEKVYQKVWELAGKPKTCDPKWGKHHVFDNMLRFVDVLEAVRAKSTKKNNHKKRRII